MLLSITVGLTVSSVILRLIGMLAWERTSAVGWARFFTEERQPYADVVQLLGAALMVCIVISIVFYAWSEWRRGK